MISPPPLKKGDTIGIVATARKLNPSEITYAKELFKSWGLNILEGKHLFEVDNQFAGDDMKRASDLQDMINNPEVKAIICGRGGYGTLRIIDKLDFSALQNNPKWIAGFSDITVLHNHLLQVVGIESIHSAMPLTFKKSEASAAAIESLRKAFFGETLNYYSPSHFLNTKGESEGKLIGGNLSVLISMMGSVSEPDTHGKILFLEDLDEYLYHIDRMMRCLDRAGNLNHLKGLIVGGMTDMKDNAIPFGKTATEIIGDIVSKYNFPVCFDFPAGHIENNMALIIGRKINFTVTDSGAEISFAGVKP